VSIPPDSGVIVLQCLGFGVELLAARLAVLVTQAREPFPFGFRMSPTPSLALRYGGVVAGPAAHHCAPPQVRAKWAEAV
jgi:hypothetical protein